MVQAMNAMGYDAMAVGTFDLAEGLAPLKEYEKEAHFPFVSANLVTIADGQPIVKPYVVLDRGGALFGILGLTESMAKETLGEASGATVLDPVQAARHYVTELRPDVDILIVLSHLGLEEDKALAASVPGIDVIVGGASHRLIKDPERVGNTLIVQQGYRGEWLGRLDVTYDARIHPVGFTEKIIALTDTYADDPRVSRLVSEWRALPPTLPPPTPSP